MSRQQKASWARRATIGLDCNFASLSCHVEDVFSHEHVAHCVAPIELAEEGELGVVGQLMALHRLLAIAIRPVQWVLYRHTTRAAGRMFSVVRFVIGFRPRRDR
jgi:hypothetical protein